VSDEQKTTAVVDAPTSEKKPRAPRKAKTTVTQGAVVVDLVPVADVVLDTDVQPRESISTGVIGEYADAMRDGVQFPPITVFKDDDGTLIAADGWHRVSGAKQAGLATILAEIKPGTKRDAVLYSVGTNAAHGVRRTDADKRRAVMKLLNDPEWSTWSASVIAEKVGVSQPFVSTIRRQLEGQSDQEPTPIRTADGRTMNTTRIGRPRKQEVEAPDEEEAPSQTEPTQNGHADDEDVDGEALFQQAVAEADADAPSTPARLPLESFAEDFFAVFKRMHLFDPNAVLDALTAEQLETVTTGWDVLIDKINDYGDVLEERSKQGKQA
jgi:hypothetical protein